MPRYIRASIPGGTFFFTPALLERRRLLTEHIDALRSAFTEQRPGEGVTAMPAWSRRARARSPFSGAGPTVRLMPQPVHQG